MAEMTMRATHFGIRGRSGCTIATYLRQIDLFKWMNEQKYESATWVIPTQLECWARGQASDFFKFCPKIDQVLGRFVGKIWASPVD